MEYGQSVVLFEMLERISPLEEPEVAETLSEILRSEGMEIVTGARVVGAAREGGQKTLTVIVDGEEQVFRGDEILIATGRRPNTDKLGVERAGIELTEAQAQEQGLDVDVRTLPLSVVPRAAVNLDTRGLVKIVAERASGRIVGATAVAENAGDVVLAAVYAVQFKLTVHDVATTWTPYLTMSEAFKLAAQIFTRDVAKLSCCAA